MLKRARERLRPAAEKTLGTLKERLQLYLAPMPSLTVSQKEKWESDGYIVLPKHFSSKKIDAINALVERLWVERRRPDNPLVIDMFLGTSKQRRSYFRDAPDEARSVPYKLNDLFLEHSQVFDISTDPAVSAIISELLDGDPIVCNNLTFELGSEQDFHFDTFYMPAPVENKMVASWVALEDVHPDSGPLRYYPGSHKIPAYRFSDGRLQVTHNELPDFDRYIGARLQEFGLKVESFEARKGDVFIWHSQLYHGGSPIKDPARTRKSLVTHYFRAQDFEANEVVMNQAGWGHLKRGHLVVQDA